MARRCQVEVSNGMAAPRNKTARGPSDTISLISHRGGGDASQIDAIGIARIFDPKGIVSGPV